MSGNEKQIGVEISAALWDEFRNDVQRRHGRIRGFLKSELEAALKEYINASEGGDTHDRLRRIENTLERIEESFEAEGKKKKGRNVSTETENKLRAIREQIERESDGSPKVHESVVEKAIRDTAGSSSPTIRRYKELLKQDRELFDHPTKSMLYFRDGQEYVMATNALAKGGKLSQQKYDEIIGEYGREWWVQQLPESESDTQDRGFQ